MVRMADKDVALALLQGAIAIAGLVLVYSGFVAAKGAEKKGNLSGDKYLWLARAAVIPVVTALVCSGMGVRALIPGGWGYSLAEACLVPVFEIVLALTAVYAIIAAFLST